MTREENEKRWQFVALCASLTKQGFNFQKSKSKPYALTFDEVNARRLRSPWTKTPYVNSLCFVGFTSKRLTYQFEQWADTHLSRLK